jgi:hypothetical protein
MERDLNAKHVDWNSKLITTRGRRLRDYANDHSSLIYGPTTIPYNFSGIPDVLDIIITKELVSQLSDNVLCTKLRSLTCTDRHEMSIIFP